MTFVDPVHRQCLKNALRILGRRDHSIQELRKKLQAKGFLHAAVNSAIDECLRLNYLNEERYAEILILDFKRRGYGPLRAEQRLKTKGVTEETIRVVLDRHLDHEEQAIICRRTLKKKLTTDSANEDPARLKAKRYRFLYNRGFTPEIIRQVLSTELKN